MTARQPTDDLLTTEEVAELLKLDGGVQALWTWRYKRVGPPSFKVGRRIYYRRRELDEWIAKQEQASRVESRRSA